MSRSRISIFAASLMIASPLVAQWQECYEIPYGYNVPFLDDCKNGFFAEVDYLLWYANQEGLSFAAKEKVLVETPSTSAPGVFSRGSLRSTDLFLENKWNSGVRACLGFKPACRSWDTRVTYSYFQTQVHPGIQAGDFASVGETESRGTLILTDYIFNNVPLGNLGSGNSIVTSNDTKWRLSFNQVDWDFSREVYLSKDALFRPFFGLRGLWVNQKLTEIAVIDDLSTVTIAEPRKSNIRAQTHFEGVGVNAGFDLSYDLFYGIELYGDFAGSILWGRFKTIQELNISAIEPLGLIVLSDEKFTHTHHDGVLNFDVGIGLKWNYWIRQGCNLLTLKFGWEQHLYTNMNQLQTFIGTATNGTPITAAPIEANANKGRAATNPLDRNVQRGNLSLSGFIFGASYTF